MVPTAGIYSIQFKFWSPQLHQHFHLHSTCHLNNKSYRHSRFVLTPISTLVHPVPVTGFMQFLQTNDFITLYTGMLPFIALHFLCTHFWQLAYAIELIYYQRFYHRHHVAILSLLHYILPFPTNHNLGFIHIYSHISILHVILPLGKPFNWIIFSFNYHNKVICIQQLPW